MSDMINKRPVLALDVGGTSLKTAIVTTAGEIMSGTIFRAPIDSKGSAEHILSTFTNLFVRQLEQAAKRNSSIGGIAIGMPGPFDYENGISFIRGVDKYEAIYGINLRSEFLNRLQMNDDFPILFENDAWAFVRGESWRGAAQGYRRIIGITLGTGFGSGFMIDDEIVASGRGVPPLAWIGGLAYGRGKYDDRISRRGMIRRYQELTSSTSNTLDVKDIAQRAATEPVALQVFRETGEILAASLIAVVQEFQAEIVVVGGQIAQSYHLFAPALHQGLRRAGITIPVQQAQHLEHSALLGASRFLFKQIQSTQIV